MELRQWLLLYTTLPDWFL